MPVVGGPLVQDAGPGAGEDAQAHRVKKSLLEKIQKQQQQQQQTPAYYPAPADGTEDDDADADEAAAERAAHLSEYRQLIDQTLDLPLEKVVLSPAGCGLFDELCLRVDVNQKYAATLPQWQDLAHSLDMDALHAQWVQTCVRPKEGLTRAMLEIYMRDGGTLGEVLQGLYDLQCLEILEKIKPKLKAFLQGQRSGDLSSPPATGQSQFFSLLATLTSVFGTGDACSNQLQALAKQHQQLRPSSKEQMLTTLTQPLTHTMLLQSCGRELQQPNYDPRPLSREDDEEGILWKGLGDEKKEDLDVGLQDMRTKKSGGKFCSILLLFSDDGLEYANQIYDIVQGYEYQDTTADVFRLNESSLWYELLVNPEACCQKWADEADYIMPVLTPKLLQEVYSGQSSDSDSSDSLVPTSPLLNRFMYTLLRARYMASGCRNTMVRPVVPEEHLGRVGQAKAVKTDPLFRLVWVPLKKDRLTGRVKAMLAESAKSATPNS